VRSCGQALSVLEHIFTDFHVLYGDEIISVILPIFDAIYASGTVALTRSVYRRCALSLSLSPSSPPQLLTTLFPLVRTPLVVNRGLDFLVHAASVTKSNKFFAVADVMEKASR
jgi:hypothetical protein